ncbi:MAG: SMP-30/gluconolactonase/LRE family protein [Saprospiraceae bacterium]|nr:SMP-30/gluconolactonase/LRE family protein [Saprospiraceae bacterium]MBK8079092.1 SMP-30/gluconolactonase/LRE family protein [Saprospiraceae bacterium]MBK9042252.1 SMP-30/gluconolactonase/LRE family protein [Saprospiraceae bacterium]
MIRIVCFVFIITCLSCGDRGKKTENPVSQPLKPGSLTGNIVKYDPELDVVISVENKAEVLAAGFDWSEGPLWLEDQQKLIFSDIPNNRIYEWTALKGKQIYLEPSGYTKEIPAENGESGSNGLTFDREGKLLICQHGDRRVVRMDVGLDNPAARFTTLASTFEGKKFNSPNDLVCSSSGEIYFTDPPYGLPSTSDDEPKRELPWNGVYKIKKDGKVILLTDSLTRPNGIILMPGEKQLIVANSDRDKPNLCIWDIEKDSLKNGRILHSFAGFDKKMKGLPDGLKVDSRGYMYVTGPGGVYFFNKEGKKLGLLSLENPASNCTLSDDEKFLYITNESYILRVALKK